jgi:hypothetical protein
MDADRAAGSSAGDRVAMAGEVAGDGAHGAIAHATAGLGLCRQGGAAEAGG